MSFVECIIKTPLSVYDTDSDWVDDTCVQLKARCPAAAVHGLDRSVHALLDLLTSADPVDGVA